MFRQFPAWLVSALLAAMPAAPAGAQELTLKGAIDIHVHQAPDSVARAADALTIARLDEEEVDVEAYVQQVERMAGEIRGKLPPDAVGGLHLGPTMALVLIGLTLVVAVNVVGAAVTVVAAVSRRWRGAPPPR